MFNVPAVHIPSSGEAWGGQSLFHCPNYMSNYMVIICSIRPLSLLLVPCS